MRRIDDPEKLMRQRIVTYELDDGRRIDLDANAVKQYGAAALLRAHGLEFPTDRVPVHQGGRRIGTVPGDFIRADDHWIADKMLGAGDLGAIPGFLFDDRMKRP